MPHTNRRATLLVTTALAASGLAGAAFAQAQVAPNSNQIEEVVVTATRQTSTVNKVALSVSAVTQKNLDQQGIRNVQDLSQQVPGFSFRTTGGDNNPQLTIRGIGGNAIGGTSGSAPTTGVYIDDLPVMKRNTNGLLTGSGSPVPLLYDLDRIEVLRGPQGTLYGGSSEGGTLRFITPQPSLTAYSGSARLGASTMAGGGYGDEEGLALGGPLVQDKLGFRVSGFRQQRPGWVDSYSEYDGHKFSENNNWGTDYSLHGALLWQVTPAFKANLSVFHQMNYDNDGPGVRGPSPAINIPVRTFANCNIIGASKAQLAAGGQYAGCLSNPTSSNGVSFSFPATVFGGYTIPAQTWFSNYDGASTGRYLSPTNPVFVASPRRTQFTIPSLTLDYNWGDKLDFKSITAYTDDRTSGWQFSHPAMRTSVFPNYTGQTCPSGPGLETPIHTAANACLVAPQYLQLPADFSTMYPGQLGKQQAGPADTFGYYLYNNRRGQTTQEFRVTTTDPSWRLQFVVGAFIEHEHNHVNVGSSWNETLSAHALRGVDEAYFAGGGASVPVMQVPGALPIDVSTRNIDILEDEQSVFADVTFAIIPDKLKIEAGVRATNYQQRFGQQYGGDVAGAPTGFFGTSSDGRTITVNGRTSPFETNVNSLTPIPTNYAACPQSVAAGAANPTTYAAAGCPYQYTGVVLKEQPITPKVGASYQITSGDMVYVTYAEGQRPGGINPQAPATQCASDFANLGITATPSTYQHDTVKSTEVGGKFRLFNGQAQINASAFHIEWEGVQFVVNLPLCAFSYIANAAKAYSDGGEIQATARLWGFTINGNLGYDNARYAATVRNLNGTILANKGDNLGVPDWTANIGVQYDTRIMEFPAYARMDYSYTGKYMRTTGPGSSSYNPATTPNTINGNEIHNMNARVGFYWKELEVAGYVKNLFNSREWISKGQGSGSYYFAGSTVAPRTIGVQMNYRF
jgi:outer membrane receptor protein involved in Fe transport